MSEHTLCDKCGKSFDADETRVQVSVMEITSPSAGVQSAGPSTTYDYHPNHVPKFEKKEPAEPAPGEPVVDNTLPEPEG